MKSPELLVYSKLKNNHSSEGFSSIFLFLHYELFEFFPFRGCSRDVRMVNPKYKNDDTEPERRRRVNRAEEVRGRVHAQEGFC